MRSKLFVLATLLALTVATQSADAFGRKYRMPMYFGPQAAPMAAPQGLPWLPILTRIGLPILDQFVRDWTGGSVGLFPGQPPQPGPIQCECPTVTFTLSSEARTAVASASTTVDNVVATFNTHVRNGVFKALRADTDMIKDVPASNSGTKKPADNNPPLEMLPLSLQSVQGRALAGSYLFYGGDGKLRMRYPNGRVVRVMQLGVDQK